MPKFPKKLNPDKNFKIEGFFGNMTKDSKKIEDIKKDKNSGSIKKEPKNKKEKITLSIEEKN